MAANKLTALAIGKIKPTDKDQLVSDGDNLFLSVRSVVNGGAKAFRMTYRLDGRKKWITLKANTLLNARTERDTYKDMVKQGIDPAVEKKLISERNRAAQLAEQAEIAKQQALISVNHLFERWIDSDIRQRKDLAEIKRMFAKDVLLVIGGLTVADVRKGHITDVIDRIKKRDAKHLARNILKLMRQMFRFAVDRDIIEFDPTASLSVTKTTTKLTERDRVLSEEEVKQLHSKIPSAGFMPSTECAIWIMLATCCRVGELSKAEWSHINFEAKTFFIPIENSKTDKAHTIYLSAFALNQFKQLAQIKQHDRWLFPNRDGSSHVCEKSITKQVDGRQNKKNYSNRSKHNDALILPGGKWTPHDLRRSGATLMGDLGVHGDVIEKCLNHTEENKLKRVYQHQELKAEQAEAWRILGERLNLLTGMVVPVARN